jgi:hypothetical protein
MLIHIKNNDGLPQSAFFPRTNEPPQNIIFFGHFPCNVFCDYTVHLEAVAVFPTKLIM